MFEKLRPLYDRVLVKREDSLEEKTASALLFPMR